MATITANQKEEAILWRAIMNNNAQNEEKSISDFLLLQDLLKIQQATFMLIPKRGSKKRWNKGVLQVMEQRINSELDNQ